MRDPNGLGIYQNRDLTAPAPTNEDDSHIDVYLPKNDRASFSDARFDAIRRSELGSMPGSKYQENTSGKKLPLNIGIANNQIDSNRPEFSDARFEADRNRSFWDSVRLKMQYADAAKRDFLKSGENLWESIRQPRSSAEFNDTRFSAEQNRSLLDSARLKAQYGIAAARNLYGTLFNESTQVPEYSDARFQAEKDRGFLDAAAGKLKILKAQIQGSGIGSTKNSIDGGNLASENFSDSPIDYSKMLVKKKGAKYSQDQIVDGSHIYDQIDNSNGRMAGNSRVWGDANPDVQKSAINALIAKSRQAGLNDQQTALVLAIAHTESGFNPDATAGTTSASGLGQFIDKTGKHYGVNNANRWDLGTQADALVKHTVDNLNLAQKRGQGIEYAYKYHHDGPSKNYGGLGISNDIVMPLANQYLKILKGD
ncbi:MAG: phage tail tip lysozyme [Undibacterium umbellatum]|uniref:phage tail tip lysozyme n=1 Tax=Undibacterium umbellatum TaxID=2762300 RepID=UPI003BB5DA5D